MGLRCTAHNARADRVFHNVESRARLVAAAFLPGAHHKAASVCIYFDTLFASAVNIMTSVVIDAGDDLPLTMPALWRRRCQNHEARTLLVCDEARLSYGEADARSRRLARGLLAAGATKGCHVALLFPNGIEFIVGLLAAARIGAVVVPLSTLSTADELRWLLRHCDAAFLLAAREFRSRRYDELLQAAFPELDFSRPPPLRSEFAPWLTRICFSGPKSLDADAGMVDRGARGGRREHR